MVNDSTREYSVYLADEKNSVSGSGVLFYAGGDTLYVFTCAHVVDNLETVKVFILKEKDASRDLYEVFIISVPASQIVFSPLDVVTEEEGGKTHTEDLAIIQIRKPDNLEISKTDYFVTETFRKRPVYVQGFPGKVPVNVNPIEHLVLLHGYVQVNPADSNRFTIVIDDPALDRSNRVHELEGLSGAPVWKDDEEVNGLLGLFTEGYDTTAHLSRTYATKAQQIRTIMNERFGIVIEQRLEGIPESDVAVGGYSPKIFDGTLPEKENKTEDEQWIEDQLTGLRFIIEDMKLQNAIDKGKELVADPRYRNLCKESKLRVKQHLLYCYEIADLDDEFEALEEEMRQEELIKDHDTLRQFTRTFMKRQFQETVDAAQKCIDTWDGSKSESLLSIAKAYLLLAKAYTEDLPVEETIGKLLDDKENLTVITDDSEDAALIYQTVGYVYGEKYHKYVNSVRILNRSFQIGYDSMVLESLGAAYYFLGTYDATDENGIIPDPRKIDFKALYKARDCFLTIISKADDLFWAGTMRRMGLCVYNTFVFLRDNYRILTLYKDVRQYMDLKDHEWRDVEMKYAKVSAQKGEIKTDEFPHIRTKDRILLDAIAVSSKCFNLVEDVTANVPRDQIRNIKQLEVEIRKATRYLEDAVRRIDRRDRVPLYVQMINLYGRGMLLYGWDKKDKLNDLFSRMSEYADEDLLESMSNFIFEMGAPIEESIARFRATFEKKKTLINWQELNHLYIRHGMLDQSDRMYRELLSERKELIEDGPEYAYRAFIDYVTMYKRDLRYALQCYLDAKESFKDTDIEGFWELELMLYSSSFNNPERFEVERKYFVDQGLITEEAYHRAAFIANLTNLNEEKAKEHNEYIRQYPHIVNPKTGMLIMNREEIHFLNWIGAIQPGFLPPYDSLNVFRAAEVRNGYNTETWHRVIDKQAVNQFNINKKIAIDAWSLYQLLERGKLDVLNGFDSVYVTHMTIIRLFEEYSRTNNPQVRQLLDSLKNNDKVMLYSAGFKAQLEVRNVTRYFEPHSTVAVGVEKDCMVVYGEPVVDDELVEHFGNRIIRVSQLKELVHGMTENS